MGNDQLQVWEHVLTSASPVGSASLDKLGVTYRLPLLRRQGDLSSSNRLKDHCHRTQMMENADTLSDAKEEGRRQQWAYLSAP